MGQDINGLQRFFPQSLSSLDSFDWLHLLFEHDDPADEYFAQFETFDCVLRSGNAGSASNTVHIRIIIEATGFIAILKIALCSYRQNRLSFKLQMQ